MARDTIEQLTRSLRVPRRRRWIIERELRAHLEDSRRDLETHGVSPSEAAVASLTRLGDPDEIALQFDTVYRPKRRSQLALALALASGMILGGYGIGGSLARATPARHPATTHRATAPAQSGATRRPPAGSQSGGPFPISR